MPDLPTIDVILAIAVVIFLAIGIHEYAHAKLADMAGDPTPGFYGRVTLNLTKHFEVVGTIMIVLTSLTGFGIGWGKPVPMDPRRMKNPRWDHFVAVLGGPISNLLQAAFWAILLRSAMLFAPELIRQPFIGPLLLLGVLINVSLFLFNLIPLGPLDGMWILGTFLPEPQRLAWTRWNLTVGSFALLIVVLAGQWNPELSLISRVLRPASEAIERALIGPILGMISGGLPL